MSSKADAVHALDGHWRYAELPKVFKRWFATSDWKARRSSRKSERHIKDRTGTLNRMLSRHGKPDLQVRFVGDPT